jgi:hypothetical protein
MSAPDRLRVARVLTRWLDQRYLDPILGFVLPGAGDVLTAGTGVYLVGLALKLGLPPVVIARMLLNLAVDLVAGAIPLLGDLFDLGFRANLRNLALLERRAEAGRASASDWLLVAGAALLFLAALVLPIVLLVWALRRL